MNCTIYVCIHLLLFAWATSTNTPCELGKLLFVEQVLEWQDTDGDLYSLSFVPFRF